MSPAPLTGVVRRLAGSCHELAACHFAGLDKLDELFSAINGLISGLWLQGASAVQYVGHQRSVAADTAVSSWRKAPVDAHGGQRAPCRSRLH